MLGFVRRRGLVVGILLLVVVGPLKAQAADVARPNILWITSEDNSPYLGCYGDESAVTPHLDQFAAEGVRYRNAFANAPVCSTARSTLIMGMYACSLGIQHHRSKQHVPQAFLQYPQYLRQAGYYCTNNSKEDYNYIRTGDSPWNESSRKAHYRNRKPGQPFFAVFNTTLSHEGQLLDKAVLPRRKQGLLPAQPRIPPEKVILPPYHADTPVIREDWSRYYDNITLMDSEVGRLLAELQEEGLADETIVFYYSDHGGALPRGKRNIHDSGTRVPLIIRTPAKWAKYAPGQPGEWVEQPVSFVDLPATLLSLAGIRPPKQFEGRAFLGEHAVDMRDHVFLFRGRMDERYDMIRAIRDKQFRYVRNYSPHRPWGQHYSYPFEVLPSMGSWHDAWKRGECNAVQARYWQSKPAEELYDVTADPFEVKNLADDPQYASRLQQMRKLLRDDLLAIRDVGFIPEAMYAKFADGKTLYEYGHSADYPLERIITLADAATSGQVSALPSLQAALGDSHPVIRYWGAVGCLILKQDSAPLQQQLLGLLDDPHANIRATAAEALSHLGQTDQALRALEPLWNSRDEYEALAAVNALDFMQDAGTVRLQRVQSLLKGVKFRETPLRISKYLLGLTPVAE